MVIEKIAKVDIKISGNLSLQRAVIIPNKRASGIPIIMAVNANTKEFLIRILKISLIGFCPLSEYPKSPFSAL